MTTRQLDADQIYHSLGQRLSRQVHLYKARLRPRERNRVQWLSQFFGPGAVILDVGAHFGYFSKEFARLYDGSCTIYAFEPVSYNFGILEQVTARMPTITRINQAVSDSAGTVELKIPVKARGKIGPGIAHLGEENSRDFIVESVPSARLDDFVRDRQLDRVDFIKIDVEGAELLALQGATETLAKFRPVVFAEICDTFTARLDHTPDSLFTLMAEAGYAANRVRGRDLKLIPVDQYQDCGDYLFIHESKG